MLALVNTPLLSWCKLTVGAYSSAVYRIWLFLLGIAVILGKKTWDYSISDSLLTITVKLILSYKINQKVTLFIEVASWMKLISSCKPLNGSPKAVVVSAETPVEL